MSKLCGECHHALSGRYADGLQCYCRCHDVADAASALLEQLERAIQRCPCSVQERLSGHRVDCWAPEAIAVIAQAKGEA
jgi:hypothetical protein